MNQDKPFDVIVAGLGPAGVTAAVYSFRNNYSTLLLGQELGGATLVSGEIENWPGMVKTNGFELSAKFEEQIRHYCQDGTCLKNVLVSKISKEGNLFKVEDESGDTYLSKTVIYVTGRRPIKLRIPGEEEYKNKGVTYCATCDGPLYKGKEVAVIGGANSALKATQMLMNIASKVTIVTINDKLKGDEISVQQLEQAAKENSNLRIVYRGNTMEVKGDGKFVSGVVVENMDTKEKEEIPVKGIFVEIGSSPIIDPVKELGLKLNKGNEIEVSKGMETNIPGFFAAGDVTDIHDKQIIVAAGSGCTAALSAQEYLTKNK